MQGSMRSYAEGAKLMMPAGAAESRAGTPSRGFGGWNVTGPGGS